MVSRPAAGTAIAAILNMHGPTGVDGVMHDETMPGSPPCMRPAVTLLSSCNGIPNHTPTRCTRCA